MTTTTSKSVSVSNTFNHYVGVVVGGVTFHSGPCQCAGSECFTLRSSSTKVRLHIWHENDSEWPIQFGTRAKTKGYVEVSLKTLKAFCAQRGIRVTVTVTQRARVEDVLVEFEDA